MAQLLANYTWPWYKQNVQLFKDLYNIQLVDDITSRSEDSMLQRKPDKKKPAPMDHTV